MKQFAIIPCLFLAACANDNYYPRTASLGDDLHACKHETIQRDAEPRRTDRQFFVGPLDGVVSGVIQQSKRDPNAEIEECMAKKGYQGTSEN